MVKLIILIPIFSIILYAQEIDLDKNCLYCHKKNQIPNQIIYKKYLEKYSTANRMQEAIFDYLKNPNKKYSIMPNVFFTKFPMKQKINLDNEKLRKSIKSYLKKFDIKKRLVLE